jgi:hypothetical protein
MPDAKSKHDADCLRRKDEDVRMLYVCTCGLADEQVKRPAPSQPSPSTRTLADELRHEASELRFRVGRYHGEDAVDRRYLRASRLMEKAAAALQEAESR